MFGLKQQLQQTTAQKKAHIAALDSLLRDQSHRAVFDHLYMNLDVIDNKAGALVQFNSISVVLYTVVITALLPQTPELSQVIPFLANFSERDVLIAASLIGGGVAIWSTLILFSAIYLHWSDTLEMGDVNAHALKLLEVRNGRTIQYRAAHTLCLLSYLFFTFTIIFYVVLSLTP